MRYLYLLHVEEIDSSPDEVFLTDRPFRSLLRWPQSHNFIILYRRVGHCATCSKRTGESNSLR